MDDAFKMDRSHFRAGKATELDNTTNYYKNLSWQESLKTAMYLNAVAYKLVGQEPISMDKTHFTIKKRSNG